MPDITSSNIAAELAKPKLKAAVGAALDTVSTTAELSSGASSINTVGKYKGKQVFNETTGMLVIAAGPLPNDSWKNAGTGEAI